VVVAGDTLSKIAQKYYGDPSLYTQIFEANRDVLKDPNKIFPGQTLKIP
jgi:nucleoid-associated protein YgaU